METKPQDTDQEKHYGKGIKMLITGASMLSSAIWLNVEYRDSLEEIMYVPVVAIIVAAIIIILGIVVIVRD